MQEEEKMEGLIFAMCFTVLVFVIFGRDEEGRTRFERRKMNEHIR